MNEFGPFIQQKPLSKKEKYPTKQRKDMRGLRAMAKVAERTV